jgi:hypothetical protein
VNFTISIRTHDSEEIDEREFFENSNFPEDNSSSGIIYQNKIIDFDQRYITDILPDSANVIYESYKPKDLQTTQAFISHIYSNKVAPNEFSLFDQSEENPPERSPSYKNKILFNKRYFLCHSGLLEKALMNITTKF